VNKNIPHEFCSILNKNIGTLTAVDFYSLSLEYIGTDLTDLTFVEYLQLHPRTAAALFILVIVLVVVILVMAFVSRHKAEREKQQRDLREAYRKTEAALAEAQQYRHAVLSDAFVVYDANITKNIIDEEICEEYGNVRHSLFEPLGLSAPCCYETYIDKVCERMTQLDDREVFREKLSREYLLSLFEQGRTEDVFEYRTKLIDGQTADVRHTTYLTADSAGNVIAHINDKNITAQKKNEQQIRKYEQILITTATDTYKGVRRVDLDTGQAEYIRFNDGQITQSDMGDWTEWMSRQNVNIHPDDFERMKKFLSIENFNKMKVGVTLRQDYRSLATNHKNFHRVYTTTASVSYLGDKKVAVMTTMDNTSAVENEMEQKKLVEDALRSAEEANSAKTVFLSNMSHDIRTPMNAIIGFTNLAQTHMNDKEQVKNYLEKISSSSMHLLSLINDVLDMSRIESGRLQLEESECSLKELAEEVSEIVQSDIESKGLSFTVDTSDIRDDRVICDKVRLKRVLLNLLSNAVKFTDTGGITVTLREVNSDGKETAVYEFHVQDTGIGISEEFIRHVFEPFERERNTTVSGVQGTGLGMSISKNIVDMMGGNISVNSVQGKGSEFTAIIPMKKTGTITDITHEAQKDFSRENIKGKKVLLVEDNELNREIAAEILRDAGVITEEADDGSVAVEMLNQMGGDYYDLVLMDIQMPKMDGYTATRIIRKSKDKAIAKIPIIAMTANAFEEDRQKAIAAGMNAHLPKPISVDLLLDTLEQLIG
jgi:signal transduction histidine kinase/CheY-like chemotaxis protein